MDHDDGEFKLHKYLVEIIADEVTDAVLQAIPSPWGSASIIRRSPPKSL